VDLVAVEVVAAEAAVVDLEEAVAAVTVEVDSAVVTVVAVEVEAEAALAVAAEEEAAEAEMPGLETGCALWLTVVTKISPGEIHVTNVHKRDLKAPEVVMTEAAVDLEAVEVDVVEVDLVVAVEEVVIAEEVAALAVAVEAVTVVVTAEAAEDLVEAVEEAVQCVEAEEVVVEIDIAPTKRNCSNLQDDSRSQDFKSRSQSLIQKIFLIFIQHHRFYKKIPPPFFQDVATSIVQHCCHALGL